MRIQFTNDPEALVNSLKQGGASVSHAISFRHHPFYLANSEDIQLLAVLAISGDKLVAVIVEDEPETRQLIEACGDGDIGTLAEKLYAPLLLLDGPVQLLPTHIAKPWGQEVWYTGMETRGVSAVGNERFRTPLPWLLSLMPRSLSGGNPEQLTLLKILDPLPDEVFGDLYFEMHERKQEVYVVTHIDRDAWPDGVGGIRFGFNQSLRSGYGSDGEFRVAYLTAVKRYESVRREIDAHLDEIKQREGVGLTEPVPPPQMKAWLADVPASLTAQELQLREQMNAFSNLMPLRIGDVVKVPCMTPHSLLHGVRTVEFQTPVYERKILSFAQKVLTQEGWDTEEALQAASLEIATAPIDDEAEVVPGLSRQLIVDFDDFRVWRLRADVQVEYLLSDANTYQLLMAVSGAMEIADQALAAEQAVLIPANADASCSLSMAAGAVALLATPNNSIS